MCLAVVFGAVGCKAAVDLPSDAQGHAAFANYLNYLGSVNLNAQDSVAAHGYDNLVSTLKPCDSKKFETNMPAAHDQMRTNGYSETDTVLILEALRRFRHDGVCG